ncbi:Phosphate ABC transporter, periplasmic phosphate-binding protein PstS (TC 3.A.1.7.1) [hydrothermal vent metagenome]|uniref:Phosphate ABC transporter, periplasmic phosphate-binding protein PstS (TC 3.A.1.7.1) n=1 Tax=hydrothermal vent metagenome TaxID=652676 RepID=A0A3B0V2F5_9ZZZZ
MKKSKRFIKIIQIGLWLVLLISLTSCQLVRETAVSSTTSQSIQNKGSDTLVNLALAWAEAYRDVDPALSIAVTGGGSGTGIAALINGTVDIANASRQMKETEFEAALGNNVEPVEFTVAIDALAVIVHPDNPVEQLTLPQLADIYTGRITNWREVGGQDAPIILLSRETNSGTHVYFLEKVVRLGDKENEDIFAPQTLLMPSSVGITSELRRNPNAIGYDGLGYVDPAHEKMLAIAIDAAQPYIYPSAETGADGSYPLARGLFMYTADTPTGVVATYLDWVMGEAGQEIVVRLGFVPLPSEDG